MSYRIQDEHHEERRPEIKVILPNDLFVLFCFVYFDQAQFTQDVIMQSYLMVKGIVYLYNVIYCTCFFHNIN